MSTSYVVSLVVLVVTIGLARIVRPVVPWRRVSVQLHPVEVVLATIFVTVTLLALGTATLIEGPRTGRRPTADTRQS